MEIAPRTHSNNEQVIHSLSNRQFPQQWYQNKWIIAVIASIAANVLGYWSFLWFGWQPPMGLRLFSMAVVVAGFLSDVYTTEHLSRLAKLYRHRGLAARFVETNPLLPQQPTLEQQVLQLGTVLKLCVVAFTFFVPLAGWGIAGAAWFAALSNARYRKQALYELELHDTLSNRNEWEKKRDASLRHLLPSRPILVGDSGGAI